LQVMPTLVTVSSRSFRISNLTLNIILCSKRTCQERVQLIQIQTCTQCAENVTGMLWPGMLLEYIRGLPALSDLLHWNQERFDQATIHCALGTCTNISSCNLLFATGSPPGSPNSHQQTVQSIHSHTEAKIYDESCLPSMKLDCLLSQAMFCSPLCHQLLSCWVPSPGGT
jgi:hypothetical protein